MKDQQTLNKQQPLVEELTVTQDQAVDLKGGDSHFIKTVSFQAGKDPQEPS